MIKRLLFSAMAVSAMAFSANADTLDILPSCGNGGWGDTSYDAATKTITYGKGWEGRGWWLESGGEYADYSAYDELVIETVDNTIGYSIVIEYEAAGDNTSVSVPVDRLKAVAELDPERKNAVKQIYLQGHAAGTLTLKAAYLQNEVVVDPSEPVVLWEGSKEIDWWGNAVDVTPADFVAAKLVEGDRLVVEYTATADNGFKVVCVNKSWENSIAPFISSMESYNKEYETIYLPTEENSITFNMTQTDVTLLTDAAGYQMFKFCGDKITLTKISVLHKEAAGIADIATDENAPVEYFNLQGVRIAEPAAGQIVIRRQGTNVSKVYVK